MDPYVQFGVLIVAALTLAWSIHTSRHRRTRLKHELEVLEKLEALQFKAEAQRARRTIELLAAQEYSEGPRFPRMELILLLAALALAVWSILWGGVYGANAVHEFGGAGALWFRAVWFASCMFVGWILGTCAVDLFFELQKWREARKP